MTILAQLGIGLGSLSVWFLLSWLFGTMSGLRSPQIWILRFGLMLIGLLVVGTYFLIKRMRRPKSAAGGQAGGAQGADEIGAMFREGAARLAASSLGREATFKKLPAIFLFGDAGATKTTTIVRAEIDAELLAGQAFQESAVIPTASLNLWLGRQTVLVDPSGALLNDPAGRRQLFRRMRTGGFRSVFGRAKPAPRAAVLCVGCESFFQAGAAEAMAAKARQYRELLGEMSQTMGISFPVYVLFTKLDAMPMFADFVANLTQEEAPVPLGVTLPMVAARPGAYADQESRRLSALVRELALNVAGRRPDLLSREHDGGKLPLIYEFPREFSKMRTILAQFLVDLGRPSQLRTNPFLRGFYFTGVRAVTVSDLAPAAPTARPVEESYSSDATRLFRSSAFEPSLAEMASPVSRRVPQWVFLKGLFHQVVLADRAALDSSVRNTKVGFWRRALLVTAAVLSLAMTVLWVVSFLGNRRLAEDALDAGRGIRSAAVPAGEAAPLGSLERLESLRKSLALLAGYRRDGPPGSLRWGLYAGDSLYRPVCRLYMRNFRNLLLTPTQDALLDTLSRLSPEQAQTGEYQPVYNALKAYLITTSHHEKSTREFLAPVLLDYWRKGKTVDPVRAGLASKQFETYSDALAASDSCIDASVPDDSAVANARAYLGKFTADESLYRAMLAEASRKNPGLVFNTMYPGSKETVINAYPVAGAFTKGGWTFMNDAIRNPDRYLKGERWVLGDQAYATLDRSKLGASLRARYENDFLRTWHEYLRATTVVGYRGLGDAASKLARTSGNQSPLLESICLAAIHTAVDSPAVAKAFQSTLMVTPAGCLEQLRVPANGGYLDGLIRLQASLQQLANTTGNEGFRNDAIANATSAQVATHTLTSGFPADKEGNADGMVAKTLYDPITFVQSLLVGVPKAELNGKAGGFCAQLRPLLAKYPFDPKSPNEASIGDLNAVFRPGEGALWQFYQASLQNLLMKAGSSYIENSSGQVKLNPGFVTFFNRMAGVSEAFYRNGSKDPQLPFTVRSVPSDDVLGFALTLDGQTLNYGAPKPASMQFVWPGGVQDAKLTVTFTGGSPFGYPSKGGLWAPFRFFASFDNWTQSGGDFTGEWTLKASGLPVIVPKSGRPATVRMITDMGGSPPVMLPGYFTRMACVAVAAR